MLVCIGSSRYIEAKRVTKVEMKVSALGDYRVYFIDIYQGGDITSAGHTSDAEEIKAYLDQITSAINEANA